MINASCSVRASKARMRRAAWQNRKIWLLQPRKHLLMSVVIIPVMSHKSYESTGNGEIQPEKEWYRPGTLSRTKTAPFHSSNRSVQILGHQARKRNLRNPLVVRLLCVPKSLHLQLLRLQQLQPHKLTQMPNG